MVLTGKKYMNLNSKIYLICQIFHHMNSAKIKVYPCEETSKINMKGTELRPGT